MNAGKAIEAAELVEAETRYLHQLAREAYAAGHADGYRAGYRQADADQAARWNQAAGAVSTAPTVPSSRNGDGDQAAAPTSQTRAPATSPAGRPRPGPNQKPNPKWRQPHDRHPADPAMFAPLTGDENPS